MATKITTTSLYSPRYTRLFRNAAGALYVLVEEPTGSYLLRIYKSTDNGASWTELSSVTSTTVHGGNGHMYMDAVMDSAGYIHVVSEPQIATTRDVAYAKFNTADDTWSAWEQAGNYSDNFGEYQVSITLDGNGKPHIAYHDYASYKGNSYDQIYYTNKTGASWSSPVSIVPSRSNDYFFFTLRFEGANLCLYYSYSPSYVYAYRRVRVGTTWGAEAQIAQGYIEENGGVFTSGSTLVSLVGNYSPSPYNNAIYLNGTLTGVTGGNVKGFSYGGITYLFYALNNNIWSVKKGSGAWSSPQALADGTSSYPVSYVDPIYSGSFDPTNGWTYVYRKYSGSGSNYDLYYAVLNLGLSQTVTPALAGFKLKANLPSIPVLTQPRTLRLTAIDPTVLADSPQGAAQVGVVRLTVGLPNASPVAGPAPAGLRLGTVDPSLSWGTWIAPATADLRIEARFPYSRIYVGFAHLKKQVGADFFVTASVDFGLGSIDPTVRIYNPSQIVSPTAATVRLGRTNPTVTSGVGRSLRVWDGNQWVSKPLSAYDSVWNDKPAYVWDGAEWQEVEA